MSGHTPTHTHALAGARRLRRGSGSDLTLDAFGLCFALGQKVNLESDKTGVDENNLESLRKLNQNRGLVYISAFALTRHSAQYEYRLSSMRLKRHPSLEARRLAKVGTYLFAVLVLCLFRVLPRFTQPTTFQLQTETCIEFEYSNGFRSLLLVSSSSSYKYHACDVTIPYATATMAATTSLSCL